MKIFALFFCSLVFHHVALVSSVFAAEDCFELTSFDTRVAVLRRETSERSEELRSSLESIVSSARNAIVLTCLNARWLGGVSSEDLRTIEAAFRALGRPPHPRLEDDGSVVAIFEKGNLFDLKKYIRSEALSQSESGREVIGSIDRLVLDVKELCKHLPALSMDIVLERLQSFDSGDVSEILGLVDVMIQASRSLFEFRQSPQNTGSWTKQLNELADSVEWGLLIASNALVTSSVNIKLGGQPTVTRRQK